jgi:hypothetical protein
MKKLFFAVLFLLIVAPAAIANQKVPLSSFKIISIDGIWENVGKTARMRALGEIKNVGNVAAGVQVQVIARDKTGRLVATYQFHPCGMANIQPGASCGVDRIITNDPKATRIEMSILSTVVWR